jgi:hypothetical protein
MARSALIFIDNVLTATRSWIAIAGGLVLIALQISWLRGPLEQAGLQRTSGLETSIVLLLLVNILLEVRAIAMRPVPGGGGRQHFTDPHEMYQALLDRAQSIGKRQEKRLDVLYSAWPNISFWLQRPEFWQWRTSFATLAADAGCVARWLPGDWPSESAANCAAIREFAKSAVAREKEHQLQIFEYRFMPSVHGFRLGNGDVFLSVVLWQDDGLIGKPGFSYEYIPAHEVGPGATALRELFANWFQRAIDESRDTGLEPDRGSTPS